MPPRSSRLQKLLRKLDAKAAVGGRIAEPWHLILLENVVYLADDATRRRAFAALEKATGLDAGTIARCPDEVLLEACGQGRMAMQQVKKLRECAALFASVGDPNELAKLPVAKARKALKQFPGIGDPGADRLLAASGTVPVLGLDSNALRVLLRLGYGVEAKAYAASYRSAQQAAMAELAPEPKVLFAASEALREHGVTVCRRTGPACGTCALRGDCPNATEG